MNLNQNFKPIIIPAAGKITLTDSERKIFDLLRDCVKERDLKVQMRVAGGWVRDKLLRIECNDVDIALDTMMGETFAGHLCDFMRSKNLHPRGVGVIQSNPDRSKHLETATINIFGQPIDFVNLRAEEYAAGSRIPEKIEFGTPLQDALRRDITINSMFYHLQEDTIEDWTGRGLLDMEEGIIRTPLVPESTLLDDPLRLLRIIRFASRYGYALVPEIVDACMKPVVKEAFLAKVSRERVGIEFDKTISNANGFNGLRLYSRLNAFSLLTMEPEPADDSRLLDLFESIAQPNISHEECRLAYLCVPLLPYNTSLERVQNIVRNAFKLSNKDVQDVGKVLKNSSLIADYVVDNISDPVKLGRLLKDIGVNWKLAVWLSAVQHSFSKGTSAEESTRLHDHLIKTIQEKGLAEAWKFAPLLTGNEIRDLLDLKEGKEIGVQLAILMDWQFCNPTASAREARAFFKPTS